MGMTPLDYEELRRINREAAFDMVRKILSTADFSRGCELLDEEQKDAYDWLEMLYYDGDIGYYELWSFCPIKKS